MPKRVLSIQSHVVYGYVGNKSAVFPLQLLGYDVDSINSVHFSNHTGHPHGWEGDVLEGDQLLRILDGLQRNSLLADIGFLLTGYIGSQSFLQSVKYVLQTLRNGNDNDKGASASVRYICDPVLGDGGKFYVPEELVQVYKTDLLPLADVVTPNQFEVEQLTGISVKTMEDAKVACDILHALGPSLVVITSLSLENDEDDSDTTNNDSHTIAIVASQKPSHHHPVTERWRIDSPILPGRYTGTGDLCAALILAWTDEHPQELGLAMEKVIGTMQAVIQRTAKASVLREDGPVETIPDMELKLIQSKRDIETPERVFKARRVL